MYDHFMTDKWTYDKMVALEKSDEFWPELLTFLEKSEVREGYLFYTKLTGERRIRDSNLRTVKLLSPDKNDK